MKLFIFRRFMLIMLLLFSCLTHAETPVDRIIFFGDSLSDNGNLSRISLGILPKSPPYYHGRFSNGPTWAEFVGKYFNDKFNTDYSVYAVGGATVIFHRPTLHFVSLFTLELQIDSYLIDSLFRDKSNVLYVFWLGSNDCVFGPQPDVDVLTTQIMDKFTSVVNRLYSWGARNFLFLNLADLGKTPFAFNNPIKPRVEVLTRLFNEKLEAAVANIQKDHEDTNVMLLNIFDIFNSAVADPQRFNEKFHINITNTGEACWEGGFALATNHAGPTLEDEIRQALSQQKDTQVPLQGEDKKYANMTIDPQILSTYLLSSPATATAYRVGRSYADGMVPCGNPDEFVFWDKLHPTEVVHRVLAQITIAKLSKAIHFNKNK